MAERAVLELKQEYKQISLFILTAYHPAERVITGAKCADGIIYPPDMERIPRRLAILRANHYAVDISDNIIAYVNYPASNSYNLYQYALRRSETNCMCIKNLGSL